MTSNMTTSTTTSTTNTSRSSDVSSQFDVDESTISETTNPQSTDGNEKSSTHSILSFNELMHSLQHHHYCSGKGPSTSSSTLSTYSSISSSDSNNNQKQPNALPTTSYFEDFILVVPNSRLTRPGDWRYDTTPLSSLHWQHGCQRLWVMDGRPPGSTDATLLNRKSHDRLLNPDRSDTNLATFTTAYTITGSSTTKSESTTTSATRPTK